jgi:hypothetical protein
MDNNREPSIRIYVKEGIVKRVGVTVPPLRDVFVCFEQESRIN